MEDLRRCTSSEAIGDITVTTDCAARVGHISSITASQNTSTFTSFTQPGTSSSIDTTDDITMVGDIGGQSPRIIDEPLDHRLPSPEEQCQIIALK